MKRMENNVLLALLIGILIVSLISSIAYGISQYRQSLPTDFQREMMGRLVGYEFSHQSLGSLKLPFRLFVPETDTGNSKLPLILVLHASGGRGSNNFSQLSPSVAILTGAKLQNIEKSIVLVPQAPKGVEWNSAPPSLPPFINYDMSVVTESSRYKALVLLIKQIVKDYPVDKNRLYVTGMSMGATGTWEFLYHYPDLFAAAMPLNGRNDPKQAKIIGSTPLWVFHGRQDPIAPIENSRKMVTALRSIEAEVQYTELDAGHGIEVNSYQPDAYRWLLSHSLNQEQSEHDH